MEKHPMFISRKTYYCEYGNMSTTDLQIQQNIRIPDGFFTEVDKLILIVI